MKTKQGNEHTWYLRGLGWAVCPWELWTWSNDLPSPPLLMKRCCAKSKFEKMNLWLSSCSAHLVLDGAIYAHRGSVSTHRSLRHRRDRHLMGLVSKYSTSTRKCLASDGYSLSRNYTSSTQDDIQRGAGLKQFLRRNLLYLYRLQKVSWMVSHHRHCLYTSTISITNIL